MVRMKKMKGMNVSDTFWTLILAVFISVMIILGIFIWLQIHLPFFSTADPVSYSIEFVHVVNKPFMVTEVLAHVRFDDRSVLEQSIETAVTSPENASTTSLPRYLSDYLNAYDLREYQVSIKNGNNALMSFGSTKAKCGDNLDNPEGWCVSRFSFPSGVTSSCGTGRAQINPTQLTCDVTQRCCKEDRTASTGNTIVSCGPSGQGVCSEGERPFYSWAYEKIWGTTWKYTCEENRVDLGNPPECKAANGGNTRACCAPQTAENEVDAGLAVKSVVPLQYKQTTATLEVTAR
ncbi:MAG: hypothetical protein J4400_04865 [Candidatus Aenigmarchaeota archaeon]|nr:hypothetical protein [Candidatus Aenigmarchaeota archaeon]